MLVTEKDLGCIILIGEDTSYCNFNFHDNTYHLVIGSIKSNPLKATWVYPCIESIEFFKSNFSLVKVEYIGLEKEQKLIDQNKRDLFYSEKYNVIFEVDEEQFFYFKLKYCS